MPFLFSSLTGFLTAVSHPPFHFSFLIWFAWSPLFFLDCPSGRKRFGWGFLAGLIGNLIVYAWIWPTCKAAGVGFASALTGWLSLSLVLALFPAVLYTGHGFFEKTKIQPVFTAALWVALEHIQTYFLTGFPWALPSHTQIENKVLIQISALTGAEGISFLIILMNASLARTFKRIERWAWTPAVAAIALALLGGGIRMSRLQPVEGPRIAILQGNIDQYQKWDRAYENLIHDVYTELTNEAAKGKVDLIVWPEGSMPGWYPNEIQLKKWAEDLARTSGAPHFIGAVSHRFGKDTNSLFHLSETGEILAIYDKRHLVPYGEYVPYGKFLSRWIPYIGQLGTFDAGDKEKLFTASGLHFAPTICYEAIFPDLVRPSVRAGADVILNVTNDGWFLQTGAPAQHYASSVLRAVELGKPVIRAANSGISAVLDPLGREAVRSPLNERGVYIAALPLAADSLTTVYFRWGRWFTVLCWLILLLGTAFVYFFHVKRTRRSNSVAAE